jgi:hypothetical protein
MIQTWKEFDDPSGWAGNHPAISILKKVFLEKCEEHKKWKTHELMSVKGNAVVLSCY